MSKDSKREKAEGFISRLYRGLSRWGISGKPGKRASPARFGPAFGLEWVLDVKIPGGAGNSHGGHGATGLRYTLCIDQTGISRSSSA